MDDLGPDEKFLFDALRAADDPTAHDRARVRARVIAAVAATSVASIGAVASVGAGVTVGTSAAVGTSANVGLAAKGVAGASSFFGWKIGVAVALLGIAGSAGIYAAKGALEGPTATTTTATTAPHDGHAASTPPTPATPTTPFTNGVTASPEPPSTPLEPIAAPSTIPGPSAPAAHVASPSHVAPQGSARSDDLEAEVALLGTAQRALARRSPSDALAALDDHARRFPRGALATEREGLRAVAACEAKRADGKALAERFVSRHASSPLVARVRSACGLP